MSKEDRSLVYVDIINRMRNDIILGKYESGMKLPSVRVYAKEYDINPNTVQKAYTLLEEEGLIFTMKTAGRYVTNNSSLLDKYREEKKKEVLDSIVLLKEMGLDNKEILKLIEERLIEVNE